MGGKCFLRFSFRLDYMKVKHIAGGPMRLVHSLAILALSSIPAFAGPADPAKLKAFVEVTGYDVIIESLQQGAMAGPGMVGNVEDAFGKQYEALAKEVFDPAVMNARAIEMLSATLTEELVDYGAEFYASELGQRLVVVENQSHMADDLERMAEGGRLMQELNEDDPERLQIMTELATSVGSSDISITALIEMQVRFTLAAMATGAIPNTMSEAELRLRSTEAMEALRPQIEVMGIIGNVYTYRALPSDDLAEYVRVLKTPEMQQIYEALNAIQYQIMIEKYEELGARMGELAPETEL
jgi:hypothetical protein